MNTVVTGCKDCPLFDCTGDEYGIYCHHPSRPIIDDNGSISNYPILDTDYPDYVPITPDWCPLKKESITIELKK